MSTLEDSLIRTAFARLGDRIRTNRDVEVLIVGGAAGILLGELPPETTTTDADAISFRMPKDRDDVLEAAELVGVELSLPSDWLNDMSGLFAWTLPWGWEDRCVLIGKFNHLIVHAACRIDLIRMKFIAHRERDLEHLELMKVTHDELNLVRGYLDLLAKDYPQGRFSEQSGKIAMARRYVDAWESEKWPR
jgi:hypothetical protein